MTAKRKEPLDWAATRNSNYRNWHRGHLIADSLGGPNSIVNLVAMTAELNANFRGEGPYNKSMPFYEEKVSQAVYGVKRKNFEYVYVLLDDKGKERRFSSQKDQLPNAGERRKFKKIISASLSVKKKSGEEIHYCVSPTYDEDGGVAKNIMITAYQSVDGERSNLPGLNLQEDELTNYPRKKEE